VERWIPADCFISINRFSNYFDLYEHLRTMDAEAHAGYLDRIERFLSGPNFYPFSIACMVEGMTRTLEWDLRGKVPGYELVQNETTLRMEKRASVLGTPVAVWIPYDPTLPEHQKMRGLWHFFVQHYPQITFLFVCNSPYLRVEKSKTMDMIFWWVPMAICLWQYMISPEQIPAQHRFAQGIFVLSV